MKKTLCIMLSSLLLTSSSFALALTRPATTVSTNTTSVSSNTSTSSNSTVNSDLSSNATLDSLDTTKLKNLDPAYLVNIITELTKEIKSLKKKVSENEKLNQEQSKKLTENSTNNIQQDESIKKLQWEMAWAKLVAQGLDKSLTTFKTEIFPNHVHKLKGTAWVTVVSEWAGDRGHVVIPPLAKKWDGSTPESIKQKKKVMKRIQYTGTPIPYADYEKDVDSVN